MKQYVKQVFVLLIACCIFLSGALPTNAQTVHENDDNNTMDTAQLIQANSETPEQVVNGTRPNQYMVDGYTSNTDVDWYKVYLISGKQNLICNGNIFVYDVYDSANELILSGTYQKNGYGPTSYAFDAPTSGYYYVRILGLTSSPQGYGIGVGGPTYSVASCDINLGRITLKNGTNGVKGFELREMDGLPQGAIVYDISFSGVRSSVDSIEVMNVKTGKSVNMRKYSWNMSGLEYLHLSLISNWKIEFGYRRDTTFSPVLKLYYVYPVSSTTVKNKITIEK